MIPMVRFRPFLFLIPLLLLGGCSSNPSGPGTNFTVPLGRWLQVRTFSDLSYQHQVRSSLDLLSYTGGTLRDSSFVWNGTDWTLDSVSTIAITFESVGDGYQRTREVGPSITDTTVRYWYFFKRGDSLYYYRGMRFLGTNVGLEGRWSSDTLDRSLGGAAYALDFQQGHLDYSASGVSSPLTYTVSGDTLHVDGGAFPFGDRYELFPGWSLYVTNHITGGYALRH